MKISLNDLSFGAITSGFLAAFIGAASSFTIVVNGLIAMGATPSQAATGLMAASILMGLCAIYLSLRDRMPISVAWSTPGAAFLATLAVPDGGFSAAVGAFIITGCLLFLSGLWLPLGRAVSKIPGPIASAMLAGVLFPLSLKPFQAVAEYPKIALPIILTWLVVGQFKKILAVPAAVVLAAILIALNFGQEAVSAPLSWTGVHLVWPEFTFAAFTGIAIPLFIITMASQNITGVAVLRNFGYEPDPSSMFRVTGLFSLAGAPFGSHALNLAAITATICADEDVNPDPNKRYWSAVIAGLLYVLFGLTAVYVVSSIQIAPPILIAAVAGLAIFGPLASSLGSSMSDPKNTTAPLITLLITASGVSFFGIGGAFWGLLAGLAVHTLTQYQSRQK